jgi:AcrR family transcriptional regulator
VTASDPNEATAALEGPATTRAAEGRRGADTKASLMHAAKTLVAERGYAGTSVRDIAAAAGANLAAVNYHFGSRETLLDEAVLECFLDWTRRFELLSQADPSGSPMDRITAGARALMADLPTAQPLFAAFLEALLRARRSPALRDRLADHYAEQRRRVAAVIAAPTSDRPSAGPSHDRSTVPPAGRPPEILASLLIAFVDGLLLQSLVDPAAVPTVADLAALLQAAPSRS